MCTVLERSLGAKYDHSFVAKYDHSFNTAKISRTTVFVLLEAVDARGSRLALDE